MSLIWFDTEFIDDGKTIELISIGLVREDGAEYYAEPVGVDYSRADLWIKDNVIAHLTGITKSRAQIAQEIIEFVGKKPEFWAYYASYDWVALCQLYGTMMQLPDGWPMYCRDLKQLRDSKGNPDINVEKGVEHSALDDARWTKLAYQYVNGL